jgi:heptosyltransferase-2
VKIKRILVVNMNYLGDALMTTPAIRALKQSIEGVTIDVIAGSTAHYGALEVLSMCPDIDLLIPRADGGSFARGKQLFRVISVGNYDLVVILPTLPFYSMVARMTGSNVLLVPKADESKHMADHMLESLTAVLPDVTAPRELVMSVPDAAIESAAALLCCLRPATPLILLNVGASRPQKRWPVAYFAEAAKLIVESGCNVALVGGSNAQDLEAASEVMRKMTDLNIPDNRVIDLVGGTTLGQLSAIIQQVTVVVTADTGAMHIASALGVPLVALFGSTSAHFTGPYGSMSRTRVLDLHLACAPCITHPTCNGRFDCMTGITPKDVMKSILDLMESAEAPICTAT